MQVMELSQFSDYSLRVMMFAGLSDRLVSVPEIAKTYQISQHHLVKIVHHLSKHEYLKTYRGRSGGFRLARDPSPGRVSQPKWGTMPHLRVLQTQDSDDQSSPGLLRDSRRLYAC